MAQLPVTNSRHTEIIRMTEEDQSGRIYFSSTGRTFGETGYFGAASNQIASSLRAKAKQSKGRKLGLWIASSLWGPLAITIPYGLDWTLL